MKKIIIVLSLVLSTISIPAIAEGNDSPPSPRCAYDPKVPKAWKEFQDKARNHTCLYTFRYVKSKLTKEQPKTPQTSRNELLPTQQCRLEMFPDWNKQAAAGDIVNPHYKLLIIPFQSPDYKVKTNPQKDYKEWFKGMEDMIKNMSDVPATFDIIVPDKYFMIQNTIKSYDVGDKWIRGNGQGHPDEAQPNFARLAEDVVRAADPEIDFSVANHIWIVGPPTTKRKDMMGM